MRLESNPGKPFVWLLYECGSFLFILDEEDKDAMGMAHVVKHIDKWFGHDQRNEVPASKWYYSDGECLIAHLREEIFERVEAFDRRNYEGPMGERPYDNWKQA